MVETIRGAGWEAKAGEFGAGEFEEHEVSLEHLSGPVQVTDTYLSIKLRRGI